MLCIEALIRHLGKKPVRREHRCIDMMMHSTKKLVEIYDVNIVNLKGDFELSTEVTKVEKNVLLTIPNPKYQEMLKSHKHLSGITMDDQDEKAELPVHMIIGTNQYPKIKTKTPARIGNPGKPIAELTKFGWIIMSPVPEQDLTSMYLTQTSSGDYEQLCRLDVLGLEDQPTGDQAAIYEEFKEQLIRSDEGWYKTGLLWKTRHPQLPNNKMGSLGRLSNLVKRLKRQPMRLEKYDEIIQEQLAEGIIEKVTDEPKGKEFYIPHKPVIRESAESTKIRIVFDGSARANERSPSLNDCLETGPPLQNLLWNVLLRNRFKAVALAGDLKQALLQIRIREEDRDSLSFHWIRDKDPKITEVFRFTRALFGLVQSPFLLGGTLEQHLERYEEVHPSLKPLIEEVRRSLYVDDLISGGNTQEEAQNLKESEMSVF